MFVTHEIDEAADPHVPGGDHLGHRRHPDEVGAEHAHHPDLGRRLERRPEPGGVDALASIDCRAAPPAAWAAARNAGS